MAVRIVALCVCMACFCCVLRVRASDLTNPPAEAATQPSSLNKQVDSKSREPLRITVADWFSPEYHGLTNTRGNTVLFRTYVPWSVGSVDQISRLTIPIVTSSSFTSGGPLDGNITSTPQGPDGLGDIELYDISKLKTRYGEFSIGPVFTFPTGTRSGVGTGKWTIGPAIGFDTSHDDWHLGIFSQGFFSFAGDPNQASVNKIKVQPIIDFKLPDGWHVGTSDMNFTYDWTEGRFTNIPLGFEIGRSFEVYSQKLKFIGQVEYNFANTPGSSAWTFRFTLEYLLPW
jgi:hypothetical protein